MALCLHFSERRAAHHLAGRAKLTLGLPETLWRLSISRFVWTSRRLPCMREMQNTIQRCLSALPKSRLERHAEQRENPSSLLLQRFAAVIMRIREPKTTALIFASGKMVVTGAKSEDDSRLASRKYARIIQKLGFDARFSEFKIQNIVGS